jgi:hypothetical protein
MTGLSSIVNGGMKGLHPLQAGSIPERLPRLHRGTHEYFSYLASAKLALHRIFTHQTTGARKSRRGSPGKTKFESDNTPIRFATLGAAKITRTVQRRTVLTKTGRFNDRPTSTTHAHSKLRAKSENHRLADGCWALPYSFGPDPAVGDMYKLCSDNGPIGIPPRGSTPP